jgi:hypothetical protein
MISAATLRGSHLRTYNTIFQHPVSHNLEWRNVHALFRHLGHVEAEPNGNLKVTRNGKSLMLHPPRTKDVAETEELMALRHFLRGSETAQAVAEVEEANWLLVIDHHEARIFRAKIPGSTPLQILSPETEDYFRHQHNLQDFSKGGETPDPDGFFEPVVKALQNPGPILVFGAGTGKSSEMDQFMKWAKLHHPELVKRIIGTLIVDAQHLTEGELLAKARQFHATHPRAEA